MSALLLLHCTLAYHEDQEVLRKSRLHTCITLDSRYAPTPPPLNTLTTQTKKIIKTRVTMRLVVKMVVGCPLVVKMAVVKTGSYLAKEPFIQRHHGVVKHKVVRLQPLHESAFVLG